MYKKKRSNVVLYSLLGVSVGAILLPQLLPGPDDAVAGNLYGSVDECAAGGRYDRDQCTKAMATASQEHGKAAPRFTSRDDCENEFGIGACTGLADPATIPTGTAAGTSAFVPVMAGFLVGGAIAGLTAPSSVPVYRACSSATSPQNCQSASGSGGGVGGGGRGGSGRAWYTGSGYRVGETGPGSSVSVTRAAFGGSASSATLSRGGFGARASHVAS